MTNQQSKSERAKDLFFGKSKIGFKGDSYEKQPSDWYAQPEIGADIKTYTTSPSHPEPLGDSNENGPLAHRQD